MNWLIPSRREAIGKWARVGFSGLACLFLIQCSSTTGVEPGPYTPPPGSAERDAIFDAMRAHGGVPDRVFVVRYLKVQNGWAWASGNPQSPDGKNRYEPESALLNNNGFGWRVVAQPCSEEGCNFRKEVARIRAAFPAAPAGIFPK